jgi:hypothetical protein
MHCFLAGKKQCTVDNERGPHFWRGLGEFGGPGRDRTGDLFHAMVERMTHISDLGDSHVASSAQNVNSHSIPPF